MHDGIRKISSCKTPSADIVLAVDLELQRSMRLPGSWSSAGRRCRLTKARSGIVILCLSFAAWYEQTGMHMYVMNRQVFLNCRGMKGCVCAQGITATYQHTLCLNVCLSSSSSNSRAQTQHCTIERATCKYQSRYLLANVGTVEKACLELNTNQKWPAGAKQIITK